MTCWAASVDPQSAGWICQAREASSSEIKGNSLYPALKRGSTGTRLAEERGARGPSAGELDMSPERRGTAGEGCVNARAAAGASFSCRVGLQAPQHRWSSVPLQPGELKPAQSLRKCSQRVTRFPEAAGHREVAQQVPLTQLRSGLCPETWYKPCMRVIQATRLPAPSSGHGGVCGAQTGPCFGALSLE